MLKNLYYYSLLYSEPDVFWMFCFELYHFPHLYCKLPLSVSLKHLQGSWRIQQMLLLLTHTEDDQQTWQARRACFESLGRQGVKQDMPTADSMENRGKGQGFEERILWSIASMMISVVEVFSHLLGLLPVTVGLLSLYRLLITVYAEQTSVL